MEAKDCIRTADKPLKDPISIKNEATDRFNRMKLVANQNVRKLKKDFIKTEQEIEFEKLDRKKDNILGQIIHGLGPKLFGKIKEIEQEKRRMKEQSYLAFLTPEEAAAQKEVIDVDKINKHNNKLITRLTNDIDIVNRKREMKEMQRYHYKHH